MKNRIILLIKIIVCIALILGMTGCWNRRELDTLAILMGIGLDKPMDNGNIQLTAQIIEPERLKVPKQEGGSGDKKAFWNAKSTGNTVFDALRNFTHESSRKVYLPDNQVIIFGRDIAKEGVQKYIDFFTRDHETRLNVWVLVARDSAGEILDVESKFGKIPAKNIADLAEAQNATSQTSIVTLKQFLARLMSKTTAPIAPFIEVTGTDKEKSVVISETAVFKRDKLAGRLDKTETRGLLWVIGKVKSGIIVVDCPDGNGTASLEIIRAGSKITAEMKDNRIYFKIKITEEGNLGDQSCPENLTEQSKIEVLEKEKAEAIKGEIMAAFKKACELDADIFGFGEAIHKKYPRVWKNMESRWGEIFPDIELEITVDAKLRRSGKINKPVNS